MVGDPFSYAEIRMESRPWRDAMIYMKSAYIAGKLLTLACMFLLFLAFDRLQRQQDALEQRRRDFTNAIAHELKTPLAIIRNFAENLAEHNMEEKRDYYLAQIIGQTEAMDDLVVNMIEVSKLDSEELVLKKEPVALAELVRQQMAKLDPLVREKKLQVSLEEEGAFQVEGDRDYLARALWNLLANAVDHNIPGGRILVRTEQGRCIIENTAEPLADEELLHAFDLLHTGNKSRSRKEGHMGMGLFLAERILKLHKIQLTLTRTGDGVRAEIARKRD
jgi:signal transduction histidine kinase